MAKAEAPAAGAEPAPPKSKKLLIIIVALVVVLAAGGAAAFFLLSKSHGDEEGDQPPAKAEKAKPKKKEAAAPPTFMPLDAVVVNLADPGTTRYAQVGITLQVEDAKTAEEVKKFMPAIRNGILMAISRRTADELLSAEGKEKLANEILELVQKTTGMEPYKGYSPVEAVLFSSVIVQ
ncbi:MAG: flagellar basal body-associated FliL family protein [Tepidimonas sp.]|uniref:flagellar basal body-associated FliL family protein n=1 Tax=Tepidimonas sp. TaxID=2002775 RepID=UPI00298F0CA8|nr:flagellar basal body-associated FliL family protein [Tepidimonas sp.]MCS6811603.1 flagellar basal body-associated FliL family protein [Tepidimonas sp.]MDW8336809.1 flagellar basal body-associated FliL family protein [Tepidimonas sp.]